MSLQKSIPGTEKTEAQVRQEISGLLTPIAAVCGINVRLAQLVEILKTASPVELQTLKQGCMVASGKMRVIGNVAAEELAERG